MKSTLERILPIALKWLLLIMFVLGIITALSWLAVGGVSIINIIIVIVYNVWGMYYVWQNGKLTKQSSLSQVVSLIFFISSWQFVTQYFLTGKYEFVTLLITIFLTFLFLLFSILNYKNKKKLEKEEEAKELAKKQARAERKAAKQNETDK